ncbi:hypothetical protein AJ87_14710 [Rhizobium yanglingense]|nr:hypothetical protein AJ87_14710 [Rhizobium yanglingense]
MRASPMKRLFPTIRPVGSEPTAGPAFLPRRQIDGSGEIGTREPCGRVVAEIIERHDRKFPVGPGLCVHPFAGGLGSGQTNRPMDGCVIGRDFPGEAQGTGRFVAIILIDPKASALATHQLCGVLVPAESNFVATAINVDGLRTGGFWCQKEPLCAGPNTSDTDPGMNFVDFRHDTLSPFPKVDEILTA